MSRWSSSDRYARTIEIGGVHGVVAVEPASGNALRVAIQFSRLSALPAIIARLRRVFDLVRRSLGLSARTSPRILCWTLGLRRDQGCASGGVGWVRARGSRCARSADHRGRRGWLGRQACRALYGLPLAGGLETEGLTRCLSSS